MRPGHRIDIMKNNAERGKSPKGHKRSGGCLRLRLALFAALLFATRYHAEAENLLPYAVFVNLHVGRLNVLHLAALLVADDQVERDLRGGDAYGGASRRRSCILRQTGNECSRSEKHERRNTSL